MPAPRERDSGSRLERENEIVKLRCAVVGANGYSGAELVRLLLTHPAVGPDQLSLFSSSLNRGETKPYWQSFPAFWGQNLQLEAFSVPALGEFDAVFLATPNSASVSILRELFSQFPEELPFCLIDLSGAMRLPDPDLYREWHGEETLSREQLARSVYGLTELFPEEIAKARLIANPGCYATASILALAPLVRNRLVRRVRIDAKSGTSGAGRTPSSAGSFCRVNESLSVYKLHVHKHIPEIERALALDFAKVPDSGRGSGLEPLTFVTQLLPITRGILATCYVELEHPCGLEELSELYRQTYEPVSPFVRLRPWAAGESYSLPEIADVVYSNRCDLGISCNPRNGELILVSALDNLLKGAAGQALQNMNLALGLPVELGLPKIGMAV